MPENNHLKMPATLLSKKGNHQDFLRNTGQAVEGWAYNDQIPEP